MRKITLLVLLAFLSLAATAKEQKKNENYYQEQWCSGRGVTEHVLPDRTRVDCLTKDHAIEFDWANKWPESIGQSLYYSFQTGKRAGVVLIVKRPKQYKYWIRLNSTIDHYKLPIDTWMLKAY